MFKVTWWYLRRYNHFKLYPCPRVKCSRIFYFILVQTVWLQMTSEWKQRKKINKIMRPNRDLIKMMGPKTKPCGTPEESEDGREAEHFKWNEQSVNREKWFEASMSVFDIPADDNLWRRTESEMTSKAALGLRRKMKTRKDNSPESVPIRRLSGLVCVVRTEDRFKLLMVFGWRHDWLLD